MHGKGHTHAHKDKLVPCMLIRQTEIPAAKWQPVDVKIHSHEHKKPISQNLFSGKTNSLIRMSPLYKADLTHTLEKFQSSYINWQLFLIAYSDVDRLRLQMSC